MSPADLHRIGQELATIFKLADIAAGLDFTQVRVV
jgi:hypothetical protein